MTRFFLWAALFLGACQRFASSDPLSTARRYLDLIANEELSAAYHMMDDDFQNRCDKPCFVRQVQSQRSLLLEARTQLRAGQARVEMSAQLPLPEGPALRLIRSAGSDGPYLFADNPLDFYPQNTPEQALRSFIRALTARRYSTLLRFVPQSLEGQYTVDALRQRFEGADRTALLAQLAAIELHLVEPFVFDKEGQAARLPLGESKEARLLLEEGRWRVLQLE